jgi:hypothetical protein
MHSAPTYSMVWILHQGMAVLMLAALLELSSQAVLQ